MNKTQMDVRSFLDPICRKIVKNSEANVTLTFVMLFCFFIMMTFLSQVSIVVFLHRLLIMLKFIKTTFVYRIEIYLLHNKETYITRYNNKHITNLAVVIEASLIRKFIRNQIEGSNI